MSISIRPITILARRFASLPPHIRMEIALKLLRCLDEDQAARETEKDRASAASKRNFLEQFRDEVEAAYGEMLSPANVLALAD